VILIASLFDELVYHASLDAGLGWTRHLFAQRRNNFDHAWSCVPSPAFWHSGRENFVVTQNPSQKIVRHPQNRYRAFIVSKVLEQYGC
jgi:hypothetical protein